MPYNVSPADVEARWRPLSDDETDIAQTLLDDFSNDLDLARPTLSNFLIGLAEPMHTALERAIVRTLALATKRALRNPDTLSNTTIDPAGGIGVGYDNRAESLANTSASLTRADFAAIDSAVLAVTSDVVPYAGSVKLQAYPECYQPPDMTILPTA